MNSGLLGWDAWCVQQGLDEHGRPKATGGNGESAAHRNFIFYVMLEGNPLIICLPGFSPVFQHQGTEEPTNAAFNCLRHHRLLCHGASFPTSVWERENFLKLQNCPGIWLVQVDQADLVDSSSFGGFNKVYSLVNRTGHSIGGKDKTVDGFRIDKYAQISEKLSSKSKDTGMKSDLFSTHSADPPQKTKSSRNHLSGGGGADTTSLHTVLCGHEECSMMEVDRDITFVPWFPYFDRVSKTTFPAVVILVYRNGSWDTMCGTMSPSDRCCLYSTAERALVEKGKMQLLQNLDPKDRNNVPKFINGTPVLFFSIDNFVDQTSKRRSILNARVADSAKSDEVIGFFRIFTDGSLVELPGNPSVSRNVLSKNVQDLIPQIIWALPKSFPK